MTDRWLNYVLAVVVIVGLVGVSFYERPRLAEQRAEFLDQDVVVNEEPDVASDEERAPLEWRSAQDAGGTAEGRLGVHGVSAGHEAVVEIGMSALEAGGNAVDAAIAVAYALGVAEPFGSGPGGGGVMLLHEPGEAPIAYEYRETAPLNGELPAARTGVPGFIAGMEHIHAAHGTIELEDLIEPAARLAEGGVEVSQTLHERLEGAAHRLPIHQLPELFPGGAAIEAGETLRQPAYAEALRLIQEGGAQVFYDGELGQEFVDAVSGLDMEDLQAYEVLELEPSIGRFGNLDVISGPPPSSGPTLIQMLQVAEQLDIAATERESAAAYHTIAQAWRVALSDRGEYVADPTFEETDLDQLLSEERTSILAETVPSDGFADVSDMSELDGRPSTASNTTHIVVVDADGTMVSMTNTLRNFFGSGQHVRGFFVNDQLVNFSSDPESINQPEPGKRPRSFLTPTILARDGAPILGIGSAGGRRIPTALAQVILGWGVHGQDLTEATRAPRFHLEGRDLEVEESLSRDLVRDLQARGYEVVETLPTPEYFGSVQALLVDHEAGTITGVADERRDGTWDATTP
jgi:gamma-glutamyltranspeptidase / glutathione hydrolase